MSLIIVILLILMGSSFFASLFNKNIEKTIIFYIFSSIILVYIFGTLGILKFGVYTFIIISIGLGITEIILFCKNKDKKEFCKNIFTPGLLIFFILNVIILFFERERMFTNWDEFTHWGSSIKAMFELNKLYVCKDSSLLFKSYPPAMSIFQYIFVAIKGEFIEYYAYYAYVILCLSMVISIIPKLKWKNVIGISLVVIICICTPVFIYNDFYNSIYIDAALGLTFGFLISKILSVKEKYEVFDIVLICMTTFILVLLKDTGIFLAVISSIIFFIDILFIKKEKTDSKKEIGKKILISLLPLLSLILAKVLWSFLIKINNVEVMFSNSYDIKGIINLIFNKDTTYRQTVCSKFIKKCFEYKIFNSIISLNIVQLLIISVLAFTIIAKSKENKKRYWFIVSSLSVGTIIYLFGLMITYAYKFSEFEALDLASFDRYVKIYFESLFFVFISVLSNKKIDNLKIGIIAMIILMFSPIQGMYNLHSSCVETKKVRDGYSQRVESLKENIDKNSKIYFIDKSNPDYGYTYWIYRYSLVPNQFSSHTKINTTAKESNVDRYTIYLSFNDFKNQILNEYDYVYIENIDDAFIEEYGSMFENITARSLYKVNKERLEKIY